MAPKSKEKPKVTAAYAPESLESLFTSINRHIERFEYVQAAKVSDQVLAAAPGDEDAIVCKIVALVKADRIDEAFSTISVASKKFSIDFSFFEAYCLYRQNKLEEALNVLKKVEGDTDTMLLESQILYRVGKIESSFDIHQKLLKSKIDSLEVNVVADLVSLGKGSQVQGMLDNLKIKPTSSFELAYNVACSLIETNKYADADQLLLSARRIGQEYLMEENYGEEDIEIELAPIAVQYAYVQQLLGHTQEAVQSYTDIIKKNIADDTSSAVAINNLIALKGPKDISDSLKKLDRLIEKASGTQNFRLVRGLDLKLSPKQREIIFANRLLLLLHSNKFHQARELVAALQDMFPESVMPKLLQAAVLVKENKATKAEEILLRFAEKYPQKSKVILLARSQVAAAANHLQIASESLMRIPEIQHMPATVATLVSLKERTGDIDGADFIFKSAIQWWSNAMTEDNNDKNLAIIMKEAAAFKLKHGKREEASLLYEELYKKSKGSDIEALVGLIKTTADADVAKAELYQKKLEQLPGLKWVDVDSLEKSSGAKSGAGVVEPFEAVKSKEKVKRKRKRKPRYPKGFDPAYPGPPPDPERWLPKRERSSYRPKRKDKRATQVRGSQGAVGKETGGNSNNSNASSNAKSSTSNAKSSNAVNNAKSSTVEQSKPSSSKSSKKKSRR